MIRGVWWGTTRGVLLVGAGVAAVLLAPSVGSVGLRPVTPTGSGAVPSQARPVTSATLLCPGPQTLGLSQVSSVPGTTTVYAASAPPDVLPEPAATGPGSVSLTLLPSAAQVGALTARGTGTAATVTKATSVQVAGSGSLASGLVADQFWDSRSGDTRALVGTTCTAPAADQWLVGGGPQATRRERIVLTNPGANPVTATLTVLGTKGVLPSEGTNTVSIPANSRTVVLLDAIAPQEASPVVHVVAANGVLGAVLDDAWVDGATGRGADDSVATAGPATSLVVPALLGSTSLVRVAVPGSAPAHIQLAVLTGTGPHPVAGGVVDVDGGATKDIDLSAVTDAVFGLQITSNVPVVAAGFSQRFAAHAAGSSTATVPSDLAWSPAASPAGRLAGAVLGPDSGSTVTGSLVLAASVATNATVTVVTGGTAVSSQVAVPASSVATVSVDKASQVWVRTTTGQVYAAVVVGRAGADPPLLSILPLPPLSLSSAAVSVRELAP